MRLLLFAGSTYYPSCGALDFQCGAEQTPELKLAYNHWLSSQDPDYSWGMIVRASDMQPLEVIGNGDFWTEKNWVPYPGAA